MEITKVELVGVWLDSDWDMTAKDFPWLFSLEMQDLPNQLDGNPNMIIQFITQSLCLQAKLSYIELFAIQWNVCYNNNYNLLLLYGNLTSDIVRDDDCYPFPAATADRMTCR